jgi:hypothetical protein
MDQRFLLLVAVCGIMIIVINLVYFGFNARVETYTDAACECRTVCNPKKPSVPAPAPCPAGYIAAGKTNPSRPITRTVRLPTSYYQNRLTDIVMSQQEKAAIDGLSLQAVPYNEDAFDREEHGFSYLRSYSSVACKDIFTDCNLRMTSSNLMSEYTCYNSIADNPSITHFGMDRSRCYTANVNDMNLRDLPTTPGSNCKLFAKNANDYNIILTN